MAEETKDEETKDYVLPSSDSEAARLELQANLYGGMEFLEAALSEAPGRVLEVGCGTGYFSRHVASRLPKSEVVGLDLDESRLAYAREHSVAPNLEFRPGDLGALPFEDDSFDLVFSRFVMVHYPEPVDALREQARVIRPGGTLLAYDMIHDGVWFSPPRPAFRRFLFRAVSVMRERGLEPNQGLHLPLALGRAGLEDVRHQVIPHSVLGSEPLFELHRENWLETINGVRETVSERIDEALCEAAREELRTTSAEQLIVEITVLVQGKVQ